MKNHSMIFDEFFEDPRRAKALINMQDMEDVKYDDGVTYPNIAHLPDSVAAEIKKNMHQIVGPAFTPVLSFARYTFEDTKPPHWAHSDGNIARFLALIYLNDGPDAEKFGTAVLKHKEFNFETHPTDDFQKEILLGHANKKDEWQITFECPARFNRCLLLNADLVHASMGEYGKDRGDGRLVISVFFDLVYR